MSFQINLDRHTLRAGKKIFIQTIGIHVVHLVHINHEYTFYTSTKL